MKRSLKAALLSGLVFPGAGQVYLGRRRRGWIFILTTLLVFACVVTHMTVRAYREITAAASGGAAIDTAAIQKAVAASSDTFTTAGFLLLVLLWIAAILDAWTSGEQMHERGTDREMANRKVGGPR